MNRNSNNAPVYSTATGGKCSSCGKRSDRCKCKTDNETAVATNNTIIIGRSSKGRGGKPVTTISGLALDSNALKALAKQLKIHCGVGGTVNSGVIELQGEQREKAQNLLEGMAYKVKVSGL